MASILAHPPPPQLPPLQVSSTQACPKPPDTLPPKSPRSPSSPIAVPSKPIYKSMLDVEIPESKKKLKESGKLQLSSSHSDPNLSKAAEGAADQSASANNKSEGISSVDFEPRKRPLSELVTPSAVFSSSAESSISHPSSLASTASTPAKTRPAPLRRMTSKRDANAQKRQPDPTNTSPATPAASENQTRPGFVKRVGTFLKRNNSRMNTPTLDTSAADTPKANNTTATNVPTFSFHSSSTSRSVTPPSPRSLSSTIQEDTSAELQHTHSDPEIHPSADTSLLTPRQGITWGPNYTEGGETVEMPTRRRSVSQDQLRLFGKPHPPAGSSAEEAITAPVELMATFSFKSAEGAGLKARRLSTCLPDEFFVDHCELDREFKSSSIFPGRRGHTVGKGATATVKLMFRKGDNTNAFYAVKEFRRKDKDEDETEYVKKVKSEFSIAKSLHHPNIVDTVRLCTHNGRWNHVMEYCAQGELFSLVEKGLFKTHYKLADRLCFFKQLLRGVGYLHSHGIAHRDIKLENLLLTSNGIVKITDFGVSEVFTGEHPGLRTAGGQCGKNMGIVRRCTPGICGSLPYIAPEVLDKKSDYDPRPLDVWSCAIVYLTMTYGGSPWSAARPSDPHYARFLSGWDDWWAKQSAGQDATISDVAGGAPLCGPIFNPERIGTPALKRLILKMLHPMPDRRITMEQVLALKVVKGVECCAPEVDCDGVEVGTCEGFDAGKGGGKKACVRRKHDHRPPREGKARQLGHRFEIGEHGHNHGA